MEERKCEGKVAKSKQWKKEELLPENGLEDTGREKGKLGQSETVALTYIHYQM